MNQNEGYYFAAVDPLSPLTESDIDELQLPEDIGKRWKGLARKLGFKKSVIDAIQSENDSDKERCIDLLVRWIEKEGHQGATRVKLADALAKIELQTLADKLIGPLSGRRKIVIEITGSIKLDDVKETQIMLGVDSYGKTTFFMWESVEKEFKTSSEELKTFVDVTSQIVAKTPEVKNETRGLKDDKVKDLSNQVQTISRELENMQKKLKDIEDSLEIPELREDAFTITKKLDFIDKNSRTLQELYTKVKGMTREACKCDEFVRREFYDFTYHSLRAVHNDLKARVADLQSKEAKMTEKEQSKLKTLLSYQNGREKEMAHLEKLWIRLFSPADKLKKSLSSLPERKKSTPLHDFKNARAYSEGARPKEILRKSKFPLLKRKSDDKESCVLTSYSRASSEEGNYTKASENKR